MSPVAAFLLVSLLALAWTLFCRFYLARPAGESLRHHHNRDKNQCCAIAANRRSTNSIVSEDVVTKSMAAWNGEDKPSAAANQARRSRRVDAASATTAVSPAAKAWLESLAQVRNEQILEQQRLSRERETSLAERSADLMSSCSLTSPLSCVPDCTAGIVADTEATMRPVFKIIPLEPRSIVYT